MEFFNKPQILLRETGLVRRFTAYAEMETTSDESSETCPSTPGQRLLAERAAADLRDLGLTDVTVDENGYLLAALPDTAPKALTVGLIAHLDTSPSAPGKGVHPRLHSNYDGSDITLDEGTVIEADEALRRCVGDTIITSNGTTLLGADDKAGMSVIIAAAEYWMKHPEVPRPSIRIAFTPDEEIGRGAARFPYEAFGADFAYTLDGSFIGEINIETFEAYAATVTFEGVSTHPGNAKGKLVNALKAMGKVLSRLPEDLAPETTEDRRGFIHPVSCSGDSSVCTLSFILRDFEVEKAQALRGRLEALVAEVVDEDPRLKTTVDVTHTYPNMYPFFKSRPEVWQKLEEAVRLAGITPNRVPVRGGTDGSVLTKNGLLCPNIFAGGMNFHDKREWISDRVMGLSLCTVLNLMMLHAK